MSIISLWTMTSRQVKHATPTSCSLFRLTEIPPNVFGGKGDSLSPHKNHKTRMHSVCCCVAPSYCHFSACFQRLLGNRIKQNVASQYQCYILVTAITMKIDVVPSCISVVLLFLSGLPPSRYQLHYSIFKHILDNEKRYSFSNCCKTELTRNCCTVVGY